MPSADVLQLGRHLLDRLEADEAKLLVWGIVDGAFTREEVLRLAEQVLEEHGQPAQRSQELAGFLLDCRLVTRVGPETRHYRTRMAEAVRLIRRLRQWFPRGTPGAADRTWESAPTLVSDFRFSLTARRYPARTITEQDLRALLATRGIELSASRSAALAAMLEPGGRRLAKFQADATAQVLADLSTDRPGAVIVGAGTGTGKTLAFYLPALLHLAEDRSKRACSPVLALYPRNELLKDQFASAYDEARRLDTVLGSKRRVTIGIWNSYTPKNATAVLTNASWKPYKAPGTNRELGRICPYFGCPSKDCDGSLVWTSDDLSRAVHRLTCPRCARTITDDEVLLTREQIVQAPPDILFSTAESLNRLMFHMENGRVVGLGVAQPPRLVLLDEVHTYDAALGAHVACLLRRWRHAIGWKHPVEIVGLSATLKNPADFFADLVGAPVGNVVALQPGPDDFADATGHEYRLAIRGDPFSGAALLATTIQTSMLVRRALDPIYRDAQGPSKGLYGRQVFVFTDTLDLTNRLYHSLTDAERQGLAGLRTPLVAAEPDRDAAGQSWDLVRHIGFPLVDPRDTSAPQGDRQRMLLRVGRTSSQDAGVDPDADVIVATSSLEVGYDSPEVGAVIQHKAPRNAASFLQRLGRAGRPPRMRPWKVAILSDYGRDRLAYHAHDTLFDPSLRPHAVAHRNRYILRIQAVFAFMDWLAKLERQRASGTVWNDLSGPYPEHFAKAFPRQRRLADVVEEVLLGDTPRRETMTQYLREALRLDDDQLHTVLFEPPRSLFTAVLPTALRRLRSGWTRAWDKNPDYQEDDHPLPEFVPGELFSDLNLPEVAVLGPSGNTILERMGIVQATSLLAPGNVTKRFAPYWATGAHWVEANQGVLDVSGFVSRHEELQAVQHSVSGDVLNTRCLRPWIMRVQETPPDLMPTSRGFLEWKSQIAPTALPTPLAPATGSSWAHLIADIQFCTHQGGRPARVRRFALGGHASLSRRVGVKREDIAYRFVDQQGEAVALGLELEVDAGAFRVREPTDLVAAVERNAPATRTLRPLFFRHLLQISGRLDGIANRFQRERLADLLVTALTAWASRSNCSLKEAGVGLAQRLVPTLERTLEVIFQSLPIGVDPTDDGSGTQDASTPAAHQQHSMMQKAAADVLGLVHLPIVQAELLMQMPVLWGDLPPEARPQWEAWISRNFRETLGQALVDACRGMCPQYDAGDLYLDIEQGPPIPGCAEFPRHEAVLWITEPLPGGSGLIEALHTAYAADPGRFFLLLEAALGATEYEIADTQLSRIVELTATNAAVKEALAAVRTAVGHQALFEASAALTRVLTEAGVLLTHAVRSGLMARVCRPGSSADSDELVRTLLRLWGEEEDRLGIEIDVRTFAFVASRIQHVRTSLENLVSGSADPNDESWKFSQVLAMLWPRGHSTRALNDESFNPFSLSGITDRFLVQLFAQDATPRVAVTAPDWLQSAESHLATRGSVELMAPGDSPSLLSEAITTLAAHPVECGTLRFYAQLDAVRVSPEGPVARVRVRELA